MASIQNKSSREIRPKYCLYMKCSYFAMKKRKLEKREILKEVGDPIPPSTSQTATKIITIPAATVASVLNCNILKVEYRLRVSFLLRQHDSTPEDRLEKYVLSLFPPQVYLDVKFASNPEIKFPIVILPKLLHSAEEQQTDGFDAFGNYDIKKGSSFLQYPSLFNGTASTFE